MSSMGWIPNCDRLFPDVYVEFQHPFPSRQTQERQDAADHLLRHTVSNLNVLVTPP